MSGLRGLLHERLAVLDDVLAEGESMFGHGSAFWVGGTEIVHFEGDADIEIRLTRAVIRQHRAELRADERVALRPHGGDWVRVHFTADEDVALIVGLVRQAVQAHRPPPGIPAKPPPTGSELARRQRFH